MAKAGSAAALAALGALGAMALRKRGRGGDENFSEMENIPAKQAPAALRPPVAATEVEPFQENSDAVATARLERAVPRAKYDEGELSGGRARAPRSAAPAAVDRAAAEANRMAGESSRLASFVAGRRGPEIYPMKKGGMIKASKPAVGKASKRADGIAQRGKTKGRYL